MYLVIQYIKFFFRSTNQHGIHSPFVYRLVTECFYDRTRYKAYSALNAFRKRLYRNTSIIMVKDFGAGSRIFRNDARQIKKVAKTAGISKKREKLLYRLTRYLEPKKILELGTSLGMATNAISLGNKFSDITTIEGCNKTAEVARDQFEFFDLKNIQLFNSTFKEALKFDELRQSKFDLIYIDGNHEKEATLEYFQSMLPMVHNGTIMIFDDIYWSKGMKEAWNKISNDPEVTVSIDIFYWGMVFFRKEQEKEHFTIRV